MLENTGQLTVVAQTSAVDTIVDAGGKLIVHEEAVAYTTRLNNGGILDVREKGSATGIQQSSQGALVATTGRRGSQGHALMASRSASSRVRRTISC